MSLLEVLVPGSPVAQAYGRVADARDLPADLCACDCSRAVAGMIRDTPNQAARLIAGWLSTREASWLKSSRPGCRPFSTGYASRVTPPAWLWVNWRMNLTTAPWGCWLRRLYTPPTTCHRFRIAQSLVRVVWPTVWWHCRCWQVPIVGPRLSARLACAIFWSLVSMWLKASICGPPERFPCIPACVPVRMWPNPKPELATSGKTGN